LKNFKHIAKFSIIEKVESKIELRYCKIPVRNNFLIVYSLEEMKI